MTPQNTYLSGIEIFEWINDWVTKNPSQMTLGVLATVDEGGFPTLVRWPSVK